MKPGEIALAVIPQSDGNAKRRPVLIVKEVPPFGDFLICGISTKLAQYVQQLDEIVAVEDADFLSSGLLQPSLIRVGWLETVHDARLKGVIGSIGDDRLKRLTQRFASFLQS